MSEPLVYKLWEFCPHTHKENIILYGRLGKEYAYTGPLSDKELNNKCILYDNYIKPMVRVLKKNAKPNVVTKKPFFGIYNELIDVKEYKTAAEGP